MKVDSRIARAIECAITAGACWGVARQAESEIWSHVAMGEALEAEEHLNNYVDDLDIETVMAVLRGE